MTLSVISHKYGQQDATAAWTNARKAMCQKGVLLGDNEFPGTLITNGTSVFVTKFKAVTPDGMVIQSDAIITMAGSDFTDDETWLVIIHGKYRSGDDPILEVKKMRKSVYDADSKKSEYIVHSRVTVPGSAMSILSDYIDYAISDQIDQQGRNFYRGVVNTLQDLVTSASTRVGDVWLVLSPVSDTEHEAGAKNAQGEVTLDPAFYRWTDLGDSTQRWIRCSNHPELIRVRNATSSAIPGGRFAVITGLHTESPSYIERMPKVKKANPVSLTGNPNTARTGTPVFLPFQIDGNEIGWAIKQGLVFIDTNAMAVGDPVFLRGDSADTNSGLITTNPSNAGFYEQCVGVVVSSGGPADNPPGYIYFDPGYSAPRIKTRFLDSLRLPTVDAGTNVPGPSQQLLSDVAPSPKGLHYPKTADDNYAIWAVPLNELMSTSVLEGPSAGAGANAVIRVRFQAVYHNTDMGSVYFRVRATLQKLGQAYQDPDSPAAHTQGVAYYTMAANGTDEGCYNVSVLLGSGMFTSNLFQADPNTDWVTIDIGRMNSNPLDTATGAVRISGIRVQFDLKPSALIP